MNLDTIQRAIDTAPSREQIKEIRLHPDDVRAIWECLDLCRPPSERRYPAPGNKVWMHGHPVGVGTERGQVVIISRDEKPPPPA